MTARPLPVAWTAAALLGIGTLALSLAPPWLPDAAADGVRRAFSWLCHQLPDRTFHTGDEPVALCHRCLGLLAGLAAGLALAPVAPRAVGRWVHSRQQARVLVAAALPAAVDWTLGATGVWVNTALSRGLTGAAFGLAAGAMIGVALLARPPERAADTVWNGTGGGA